MSGYKRIISYIYVYENGERKDNTGFVKIQIRNGEWRIAIHLRGYYVHGQKPYRAYLYVPDGDLLQGVLLGELENCNGALEWKGTIREDTWAQFPYQPEEARGVWIGNSEEKRYASEWDDFPVKIEQFRVYEKNPEEAEEKETRLEAPLYAAEILPGEDGLSQKPMQEQAQAQEQPQAQVQAACLDSRQQKWDYLVRRFPVQKLFQNGRGAMACIRIGPRDLQRLPRDSWILGNNSFLLHGYYQYRHLLLCRQEREEGAEYYLGVPGIYNEKEQMMAELFGFAEFRRSGNPENRNGEFGYWFRKIEEA